MRFSPIPPRGHRISAVASGQSALANSLPKPCSGLDTSGTDGPPQANNMLIGVIADDFTGASDIANTLAKGGGGSAGLATTQFLGIPSGAAGAGCEAGVIALKSRSIPADEAVAQSLRALAWLKRQGCRQIVFKYCSTFDSTEMGNIGPVGEALAHALDVRGVVACPAFPAA